MRRSLSYGILGYFTLISIIIIKLYLPVGNAKKVPEESDNEAFDLRYKRCESLVYIDNKRLLIEIVAMVRKCNKFDMSKVTNGPLQLLIISDSVSCCGLQRYAFSLLFLGARWRMYS